MYSAQWGLRVLLNREGTMERVFEVKLVFPLYTLGASRGGYRILSNGSTAPHNLDQMKRAISSQGEVRLGIFRM